METSRYIKKKEYYLKNKDEINRKRREHNSKQEVKERIKIEDKRWRENHKEELKVRSKRYKKKYDTRLKKEVFEHYGMKCSCCGEDNLKLLSIDHINGKGTKHRKEIGSKIYGWLIRNNFPEEYQTLCFNCNWGRYINNGICPHKEKEVNDGKQNCMS